MKDGEKLCRRCKVEKPLAAFSMDSAARDKRQGNCKECQREIGTAYRKKNPEYQPRKNRERYAAKGKAENPARYQRHKESNLMRRDAELRSLRGRLYSIFKAAKDRSAKIDREFSIDIEWLLARFNDIGGKCEVTGITLTLERNDAGERFQNPFNPSLDRRDCTKGYTPENTRIVCVMANLAMNRFGDDAFHQMCSAYMKKVQQEKS